MNPKERIHKLRAYLSDLDGMIRRQLIYNTPIQGMIPVKINGPVAPAVMISLMQEKYAEWHIQLGQKEETLWFSPKEGAL
jgi:hypothetical protein